MRVVESISRERLEAVAAMKPATPASNGQQVRSNGQPAVQPGDLPKLRVEDWLRDRGVKYTVKPATAQGRTVYLLEQCPFDPQHGRNGEVSIMQDDGGKMSAKCMHSTCAGRGWQDFKTVIGKPEGRHYDRPATPTSAQPQGGSQTSTGYTIKLIDSKAFAAARYEQRFLIDRILAELQQCILGGAVKTMKTTIGVDITFSLGTGTRFLGRFNVPEAVNTAFISGESGARTIQETAQRIAISRGVSLDSARVFWGFDLPKISIDSHLDALVEAIEENEIRVLVIDPAYLSMMGDPQSFNPSNVFCMGAILGKFSEAIVDTGCTPILIHHVSKGSTQRKERGSTVPELEDLAFAGFAEFARQWVLIGRREPYVAGTGEHKLWLNVGGSAGHCGLWGVDISEGVPDENFQGRHWDVQVTTAGEAKQRKAEAKANADEQKKLQTRKQQKERLVDVLKLHPDGETVNTLRSLAGLSTKEIGEIILDLMEQGTIQKTEILRSNNQTYDGFKLATTNAQTNTI